MCVGGCIMGMTENKRFGMIKTQFNGLHVPIDEWNHFIFSSCESELDCMRIVNALNCLHEKAMSNGRIASELLNAKEQLEKENKELKLTTMEMEDYLARMEEENKKLREQLKDCTEKAKEEIRKQAENEAIRWANIGR